MVPGQLIDGRFVLERFVASGGMGQVFRAFDEHTGRPVALKFLATDEPQLIQRHLREALIFVERVGGAASLLHTSER